MEQSSVEAFDFMGNKKQAEARVARIIRRNWGLTCAFSWASHKISALHRLNSRSAGLIQTQRRISHEFYKLRELELRERASRLDRTDPRRLALFDFF